MIDEFSGKELVRLKLCIIWCEPQIHEIEDLVLNQGVRAADKTLRISTATPSKRGRVQEFSVYNQRQREREKNITRILRDTGFLIGIVSVIEKSFSFFRERERSLMVYLGSIETLSTCKDAAGIAGTWLFA